MFIYCPFFNVACYNYNHHSGISIVYYKILLINIVIFKLRILNQHTFIIIQKASCNFRTDINLSTLYFLILTYLLTYLLHGAEFFLRS